MEKKYSGLNSLLKDNATANQYFYTLPDYVQETIKERSDSINSERSLRDYAENLLRGDGGWWKKEHILRYVLFLFYDSSSTKASSSPIALLMARLA